MAAVDRAPLLSVQDLVVEFRTQEGVVRAADHVSFDVEAGEMVGIVGESGSGKSVTVLSILGLLPRLAAKIRGGRILFEGRDLLRMSKRELRSIRGRHISMIFQDPMTSLNPVMTVGQQIRETLWIHEPDGDDEAHKRRAIELLEIVGVPDAARRYRQYPHEFSGGMRQRVMIAMAISNKPKLLIADEPTTALDVTIQAQILEALEGARQETGAATILITHDLGLIAETVSRVNVMYAGRIVETAPVDAVFHQPRHPYSLGLVASLPKIGSGTRRLVPVRGQPPDLAHLPEGCAFQPRCHIGRDEERCRTERPDLFDVAVDQRAACFFHERMADELQRVRSDQGGAA